VTEHNDREIDSQLESRKSLVCIKEQGSWTTEFLGKGCPATGHRIVVTDSTTASANLGVGAPSTFALVDRPPGRPRASLQPKAVR
jgi:hypothetical protein